MICLYASSTDLDPKVLIPGRDLVLSVEREHGLELPEGVLVDDHLDLGIRLEIDAAARDALFSWRAMHDDELTIDSICLPWLWEVELFIDVFLPLTRSTVGIARAMQASGCSTVEVRVGDESLARLVRAAGGRVVGPRDAQWEDVSTRKEPNSTAGGARRRMVTAGARVGLPSFLRPGAVPVLGYWHLVPLVDLMLQDRRWRPALAVQGPLPGRRRSLKVATQGGWVGLPGPLERRRFGRRVAEALGDLSCKPMEVLGFSMGELFHSAIKRLGAHRGPGDLAQAAFLRRTLSSGKPRAVVVPFDNISEPRLLVAVAREHGIPTVVVQHGAFLEPLPVPDLQLADAVAVWSEAARPALAGRTDAVQVVGYPGLAPQSRLDGKRPRTITVLGQGQLRWTSVIDERMEMRHYAAAIRAALIAAPDAAIVLRPHPSHPRATAEKVQRMFAEASIAVDTDTDTRELLARTDICVGTYSTMTLQAALAGGAVVILNLTGREWGWPLGGETPVPIARSVEELATWFERLIQDPTLRPGEDALRAALGDTQGNVSERLLGVIADAAH
jgi:hypothetical protein